MAGTQVTSPNQVTRYERKNIWQIIGFISVLILIFAYKLGIDSAWKIYRIYTVLQHEATARKAKAKMDGLSIHLGNLTQVLFCEAFQTFKSRGL